MTIPHAAARADLPAAVQMSDHEHRRQQYARSARDNAAEVLLEPASTPLERDYASRYFDDADALITRRAVTHLDSSEEPS